MSGSAERRDRVGNARAPKRSSSSRSSSALRESLGAGSRSSARAASTTQWSRGLRLAGSRRTRPWWAPATRASTRASRPSCDPSMTTSAPPSPASTERPRASRSRRIVPRPPGSCPRHHSAFAAALAAFHRGSASATSRPAAVTRGYNSSPLYPRGASNRQLISCTPLSTSRRRPTTRRKPRARGTARRTIYVCGKHGIDALQWRPASRVPFDESRGQRARRGRRPSGVTAHAARELWATACTGSPRASRA
jgi:hypothetical protein